MGLASALTTALSGLTAAETTIDVVGNNLANSQTVGFKASEALFATQFLQTQSLGSAPTANTGGTNPRQVGLGVQVAEISPNFSQGTIEISTSPSDLAIQGDGFFMVEAAGGARLFTRNGVFDTNSQNELVTITGNRVLGYGIDEDFNVQRTELVALSIPLGAAAVAQATQNVFLEGTLSPVGDLATAAGVIDSLVLGNGAVARPNLIGDTDNDGTADTAAVGITTIAPPSITGSTASSAITPNISSFAAVHTEAAGGSHTEGDAFQYRITFSDLGAGRANETLASATTGIVTVPAGDTAANNTITLNNLPTNSTLGQINLYRSDDGGTTFNFLKSVAMTNSMTDDDTVALSGTALPAQGAGGGGTHAEGSTFLYRTTFVDDSGTESIASDPLTVTIPGAGGDGNGGSAVLTNLPTDANYVSRNIYRSDNGGTSYFLLKNQPMATNPVVDDNSVALTATALDTTSISGNYGYLVTFSSTAGDEESRPSPLIGPRNVTNGRIHLTDLPTPDPASPFSYDKINIYRNLSTDSNSYFLVGTVNPGESFTDSNTDAAISNLATSGNKAIDMDGPKIQEQTLLTDVVRRDGLDFESTFSVGTLNFGGKKGGRRLGDKSFEVAASTTVGDLIQFMEDSLGIQEPVDGGSVNPVPSSENNIVGESGTLQPGASVVGGKIRFTSNNGVDNGVDIDLSAFQLTDASGNISNPNLGFASVQEAVGETTATDFIVFDSLGIAIPVRMTVALESKDGTTTTYRWFADSPENDPALDNNGNVDPEIAVGTGLLSFDGEGNLVSSTNTTISIQRRNIPSTSPLEFDLDVSQLSGLAADNSFLSASRQDGFGAGKLSSFIIGEDGTIKGVFSNGAARDLGQIRLARFANASGLEQQGENMYSAGVNSGLAVEGDPGSEGIGKIIAGARELSNTDVGKSLINLILATTQYRGNTRVITAAQQLLDELLNLRR